MALHRSIILWGILAVGFFVSCDDTSVSEDVDGQARNILDSKVPDHSDLDLSVPIIDMRMTPPDVMVEDAVVDLGPGHCHDDEDCDDNIFCNGLEQCSNGRCYQSPITPCDDGVACTVDSCDEINETCESEPSRELCPENHDCDLKTDCFGTKR